MFLNTVCVRCGEGRGGGGRRGRRGRPQEKARAAGHFVVRTYRRTRSISVLAQHVNVMAHVVQRQTVSESAGQAHLSAEELKRSFL